MAAEENKRDALSYSDSSDDETEDNDRHPSVDQPPEDFLTADMLFRQPLKRQRAIGVIHHIQNVDLPQTKSCLTRQYAQAGPLPQDAPRANPQVVRGFESFPKSD